MKLTGNTILITGGSSGIGLELSKQFVNTQNKVIICGRSQKRLEEAKKLVPELEIYQCDISDKKQCADLALYIEDKFPQLNMLINNAAIVNRAVFHSSDDILNMAQEEIETNFMAPIRLVKLLLPVLKTNKYSHIVNTTTGLIYSPRADYPFYNATKAALHSFTQVLRKQTEDLDLKITEAMFPAVNTPWHNGNPPKIAISPQQAVNEMFKGMKKDKSEIRIGSASLLYKIARIAPGFAFKKVNSLVNENQ